MTRKPEEELVFLKAANKFLDISCFIQQCFALGPFLWTSGEYTEESMLKGCKGAFETWEH